MAGPDGRDVVPTVARRWRTTARATEVLDADHQPGGEGLQVALDEHLLGERVADLHLGSFLRPTPESSRWRFRAPAPNRRRCGRDQSSSRTRSSVTGTGGERQVQVLHRIEPIYRALTSGLPA